MRAFSRAAAVGGVSRSMVRGIGSETWRGPSATCAQPARMASSTGATRHRRGARRPCRLEWLTVLRMS